MQQRLQNILSLGIKELRSLRTDPVLLFLIVYSFTYAIYAVSKGMSFDVADASVAIVDEDHSALSRSIADAILEPYFKSVVEIDARDIDRNMNAGNYVFVIDIPPSFEKDVIANRHPTIQINVDATAIAQAGNGAIYLESIISNEVQNYLRGHESSAELPINLVSRTKFNPNGTSYWFMAILQVVNNITILSIILTGAAFIRERERGTVEHLLVMPVTPFEIMSAKIWANGLVILTAAALSLVFVVHLFLGVPLGGSLLLFMLAAVLFEFSVTALGIMLATFSNSMPQFGLLAMPVLVIFELLSGGTTPLETMPDWLQFAMQLTPAPHFVNLAQAILFRSAGFEIVWPYMAILALIGAVYFLIALLRFRRTIVRLG
ncbi:MAG: ABC transporter permease [Parvibaculum sp.]